MRNCWIVAVLVLLVLLAVRLDSLFAGINQIEQDFAQGKINQVEKITLLGYRLFDPQRLPRQYSAEEQMPLKCGTEIIAKLRAYWSQLSIDDQAFFKQAMQRPELPISYISPQGLFKLHYTQSGVNSVPIADTNGNSTPDYIERAGEYFDYCYHFEIDTLGYQPPPSDFGIDGPEIDVYFRNLNDAYGYTDFDQEIPSTSYDDWTSYMTLDNDFAGSGFYRKGLEALKVTAAHELFHVIQLGYNFREMDICFFEMSSTWMEDRVYNEVNDYYQYLASYLYHTDLPLTYTNGSHEYGAAIFLKCLADSYPKAVLRRTWENMRQLNCMNALDQALTEQGSDLATAFTTFALWNYFTGQRSSLHKFYAEADQYPQVSEEKIFTFQSDTTVVDSSYFLTAVYYKMTPELSSYFSLQQHNEQLTYLRTGIIVNQQDNLTITNLSPVSMSRLGFINGYNDLILIAINVSVPAVLDDYLSKYEQNVYSYHIFPGELGGEANIFPNPFVLGQHQNLFLKLNIPHRSRQMKCLHQKDYAPFPQSTELSCSILTETGRSVKQFAIERIPADATMLQLPWNGTDSSGMIVASGVYLCVVKGNGIVLTKKFVIVNP